MSPHVDGQCLLNLPVCDSGKVWSACGQQRCQIASQSHPRFTVTHLADFAGSAIGRWRESGSPKKPLNLNRIRRFQFGESHPDAMCVGAG